ncbi:MAG: AMP-binding protein, partial [Micrococcales bacterium]|nr:AMP-binding protein [Micrococcales bacterium]
MPDALPRQPREGLVVVDSQNAGAVLAALETALAGGPPLAPVLDPQGALAAATLAAVAPQNPVPSEPDVGLIVTTSGSTGHPKAVMLPRAAMIASARATESVLGGPGTWHLALPAHYVAGAMVIVRSIVAGTPLREVGSDLASLRPAAGRNYISLVPTQLVRALDDPSLATSLAAFDAILIGGARLDAALAARAVEAGLRVVTTYGMSETCGGCVYDGRPLPGVSAHLGEAGRITLTGPTAFAGYRGLPDLTREILSGDSVRTQDRGAFDAEGRLRVLGRVDDVVTSGGVNVDVADVERQLTFGSGIELSVVAVRDEQWGASLVVLTSEPITLKQLL